MPDRSADRRIDVYVEAGNKKVFASALDWPGWSRGGRSEEEALEVLAAYGSRYAKAVRSAKPAFRAPIDASELRVIERLEGNANTDFGIPYLPATSDGRPIERAELGRLLAILDGAWETFESARSAARGVKLRTGPRGGGRDLAKMLDHVLGAEEAYVGQLGARAPRRPATAAAAVEALRARQREVLTARVRGDAIDNPRNTKSPWLARYYARRSAWHLLDHAWEIEDRARPETG
jgi:hypothetical protein